MKTSNNSPADNEVAENDTPNALISDNDLLKFFNLERENVQNFSITRTECTLISRLIRPGFSVLYAGI